MSGAPVISPFPWDVLDALGRDEVETLAAARAWSAAHLHPNAFASATAALLGTRVDVLLRRASMRRPLRPIEGGLAALFGDADAEGIANAIAVEVEAPLAAALVARSIRRKPRAVIDPARAHSPAVAGGLAAVLASALRRALPERPLRVLAAGPSSALAADLARAAGELVTIELTAVIDDEAFLARVLMPRAVAIRAPVAAAFDAASLGDVPIALPIVAAAAAVDALEVASLGEGDVFMPGAWTVARDAGGRLSGHVILAAPSCEHGVGAELGESGSLVLRGDRSSLAWTPPTTGDGMNDEKTTENPTLIEALGEVPVVVRVEVGVAEMRAREWARLAKGDVMTLGRKIGEPVHLRVGSVLVARGELVDVDGEIGVRVLERLDTKETES